MSNGNPTLYFAAPLFTQAEWHWNAAMAQGLRKLGYEVFLPQEPSEAMLSGREAFSPQSLFSGNISGIQAASLVLAILDGADPDSGTCWESGYAYALGRPVIGLRTDFRNGGDDQKSGVNLMLSCSCQQVIVIPRERRSDTAWVLARIEEAIRKIIG